MTPYYQDAYATLYHADCRDVLPTLPPGSVDLVLTDPPYGMDYKPLRGADGSKRWRKGVTGDDVPFDPTPLLRFPRIVLWGVNWYASRLPSSGGWLVWNKVPLGPKAGFIASHAELAWTNVNGRTLLYPLQWGGEARNGELHYHPTQKPMSLMRWCIKEISTGTGTILDPFAGSGTTLVAAKLEGRRSIGVEIEERYCEIAANRLRQGVLEFAEPPRREQHEQLDLVEK